MADTAPHDGSPLDQQLRALFQLAQGIRAPGIEQAVFIGARRPISTDELAAATPRNAPAGQH